MIWDDSFENDLVLQMAYIYMYGIYKKSWISGIRLPKHSDLIFLTFEDHSSPWRFSSYRGGYMMLYDSVAGTLKKPLEGAIVALATNHYNEISQFCKLR